MRKTLSILFALCLGMPAAALAADCQKPPQPPMGLPNGETASKSQMIKAQKEINEYMEKAQAYVDCMDDADAAALEKVKQLKARQETKRAEVEAEKLSQARKERNAVVNKMQQTAKNFNQELDEYMARQSDG